MRPYWVRCLLTPVALSRDELAQVAVSILHTRTRQNQSSLTALIGRTLRGQGHGARLSINSTHIGRLQGYAGHARYANKPYTVSLTAVTDSGKRTIYLLKTVLQPHASKADARAATTLGASFKPTR